MSGSESREDPKSFSFIDLTFSPVRPNTPFDITIESFSSPSHSLSTNDPSSPECGSSAMSNTSKSSDNYQSSTSSRGGQPEMQLTPSQIEPQSQSVNTVELEQMQREGYALPSHLTTPGYKLVIDNIDSTVKPRHMREDAQNQSLHYVQLYAVKDCVDFSTTPDCPPSSAKIFIPSFRHLKITKC